MLVRVLLFAVALGLALLAEAGCGRSDAIVVIALHPTNPNILYVATNDYIYKSRDEGQTWENLSQGMTFSRVISMAVDPAYPAIVYAGTSGGVYKSVNGAARWEKVNDGLVSPDILESSRALGVTAIHVDPHATGRLYAATLKGLYKSTDRAQSWTRLAQSLPDQMIST